MVSKKIVITFVLPVVLSVIFGSLVLNDILQKPDRELNMLPMYSSDGASSHGSLIEIVGLSKQYLTSQPVEIQVIVDDDDFNCGDLYITIYSSGKGSVVTQGGFFEQCSENERLILPIGDEFSKVVSIPGSYEIVAEIISKELNNISTKGTFTVK